MQCCSHLFYFIKILSIGRTLLSLTHSGNNSFLNDGITVGLIIFSLLKKRHPIKVQLFTQGKKTKLHIVKFGGHVTAILHPIKCNVTSFFYGVINYYSFLCFHCD